jgi:hypothetical protein
MVAGASDSAASVACSDNLEDSVRMTAKYSGYGPSLWFLLIRGIVADNTVTGSYVFDGFP